jgi:hypothetical protein
MSFEGRREGYHDTSGIRVYLSSTLADLAPEREVALKTIAEFARVTKSFRAREENVVTTCRGDVRKCNLYIGILDQRYGYMPPVDEGNPEEKSITVTV